MHTAPATPAGLVVVPGVLIYVLCCWLPWQVVNGPEVLSKYVGQAEENIRNLFGEAEAEYKEKGDASVSNTTQPHYWGIQ